MNGFVQRGEDRLVISGPMTLERATALLSEGVGVLAEADPVFDLAGVDEIDSSGLAVLFGWLRTAKAQGKILRIINPPKNLLSLADVYGVGDLLSLS
jgi:phospholipid transport system transporter-binding protein